MFKWAKSRTLKPRRSGFWLRLRSQPDVFWRKYGIDLVATTLLPAGFSEFSQPSPALPFRWLLYPLAGTGHRWLADFWRPLTFAAAMDDR